MIKNFRFYKYFTLIIPSIFPMISIRGSDSLFNSIFYINWRKKRLRKLFKIFDINNKKILELGAATGKIGQILSKFGAFVTIADARIKLLNMCKKSHIKKIQIDNDLLWYSKFYKKNFDLIIHWGLLYHLKNWKKDLEQCVKKSKYICLETIVYDTNKTSDEFTSFELGLDQSIHFRASIPTQDAIEKHLKYLGCSYKRFDDEDLDTYISVKHHYMKIFRFLYFFKKDKKIIIHKYSWKNTYKNLPSDLTRRFWLIKNPDCKHSVSFKNRQVEKVSNQ
jgi:hypothetical protein